jgi:hypothetical protein
MKKCILWFITVGFVFSSLRLASWRRQNGQSLSHERLSSIMSVSFDGQRLLHDMQVIVDGGMIRAIGRNSGIP